MKRAQTKPRASPTLNKTGLEKQVHPSGKEARGYFDRFARPLPSALQLHQPADTQCSSPMQLQRPGTNNSAPANHGPRYAAALHLCHCEKVVGCPQTFKRPSTLSKAVIPSSHLALHGLRGTRSPPIELCSIHIGQPSPERRPHGATGQIFAHASSSRGGRHIANSEQRVRLQRGQQQQHQPPFLLQQATTLITGT